MQRIRQERIVDIAAGANVSPATVSRYFNGIQIRDSSKLRIENYLSIHEKKFTATSFENKRVIGLIMPFISNFFYTSVYAGIMNAANAMGYSVITAVSERSIDQERNAILRLSTLGISGLIYIPVGSAGGHVPEEISLFADTPLVVANRRNVMPNRPHVYIDNIDAGYIATQHLISRRRDAIGFIFSSWNDNGYTPETLFELATKNDSNNTNSTSLDRFRGYLRALKEAGIPYSSKLVSVTTWDSDSGPRGVSEIVNKAPYVNGLISTADYISVSAIYTLQRHGYNIPRDISVVGWCNSDLATLAKPMLTSVHVPLFDLGFSAVSALDRCINSLPQGNIVYNSSVVLRESTAIRLK